MALPFLNGTAKKREQMLAVDLGGRTTKAVQIERKGEGFVLSHFALLDAPIYENTLSAELLSEHLKSICQALDTKAKALTLANGVNESILRHAELPQVPIIDMRQILKNNTKNYLQQDLPGHIFDCSILTLRATQKPNEKPKASATGLKQKVLVAGARKQLLEEMQTAIRNTGLVADYIVTGLVGPDNAFVQALPEDTIN